MSKKARSLKPRSGTVNMAIMETEVILKRRPSREDIAALAPIPIGKPVAFRAALRKKIGSGQRRNCVVAGRSRRTEDRESWRL